MTMIDLEEKANVREFVRARTLEAMRYSQGNDKLIEAESHLVRAALELTRFLGYEPFPADGRFDLHVWVGRAVYEKLLRDLPLIRPDSVPNMTVKGVPYRFERGGPEERLRELVIQVVGMPSDRDLQKMPGPSDLANACDVCVARRIAVFLGLEEPTKGHIYVKTWVGTAVHEKLEKDLPKVYGGAELEITIQIADIAGLGQVNGHVDAYLPEVFGLNDYKTSDLMGNFGLRKMRKVGVKKAYVTQLMLYCYGLRQAGVKLSWANLTFIPRDSDRFEEIWTATCFYQESVALFALERAQSLVDVVLSGDRHTLSPDLEGSCFTCVVLPRLN